MTTYHCPACGLYWTPNKSWTPASEDRVYNGGNRRCPDCRTPRDTKQTSTRHNH